MLCAMFWGTFVLLFVGVAEVLRAWAVFSEQFLVAYRTNHD